MLEVKPEYRDAYWANEVTTTTASASLGCCPKCQEAALLCDNQPQERYSDMTNVWCALCDFKGAIKRLLRVAPQSKAEAALNPGSNVQPA